MPHQGREGPSCVLSSRLRLSRCTSSALRVGYFGVTKGKQTERESERERGSGLSQAADWRGASATDVGEGGKLDQRVARATCVTHIVLKQHGLFEKGGKEEEKRCSEGTVDQEVRFLSMQVCAI